MADASCSGPSPFKRLVDHQSRDVTHHQDRLVDRSASQQQYGAFRGAPQPSLHGSDDFNSFMDGSHSAAMPGMPHAHDPANRLAAHTAALQQPGALMNHQHHHHHHQPELSQPAMASPAPDATNWAADFARFSGTQQIRSPPNMHIGQQRLVQRNTPFVYGQAFSSPMYGAPRAAPQTDFDKEMAQWMSVHGKANMTEVDAAMDQMARELQLNEASLPVDAEAAVAVPTTSTTTSQDNAASARYTDLESPEIGSLSLQDDVQVDHQSSVSAPQEPASLIDGDGATAATKTKSAVSEAAERLLDSVQHESGEKWQNSVFLSLMRDFRDGRKDIVDNEIRSTDAEHGEHTQERPTT